MKVPTRLLIGAAAMLGIAAVTGQPEFIVPAAALAAASGVTRRVAHQKELANKLAEVEKRLRVTENELEAASTELDHMRVEREFDRQLLHAPTQPSKS